MWCHQKDHLRKSSKLCAFNKNAINKSTSTKIQNDNSSTIDLPLTSNATNTSIKIQSTSNDEITKMSTEKTTNIEIMSIINGIITTIDNSTAARNNQDNFKYDESNDESNPETIDSITTLQNACSMKPCNLKNQDQFRSDESNNESNSETIPSFGNSKNGPIPVSEVSDQISYYSIHPFL